MKTADTGPVYGVTLLDSLPLGKGGMLQAMPNRKDLERVREISLRTVAGFEVLTYHYRHQLSETNRLTLLIRNVIEGEWNVTELAEAIGYL